MNAAPNLRPLGVGEILDVGVKIYWRNAWTFVRIVLVVVLPAQIVVNVIQASALPSDARTHYNFNFTPSPSASSNATLSVRDATTVVVGYIVAFLVGALAGKLATAACFRAVADAYLGEQADWKSSLRYAVRRLPAVVALTIFSGLVVALGFIACVIPGIYLWGAFYVAVPVLLVEGIGPFRALGRSRRLVSGRWWGTIGVAIIGTLLASIVAGILGGLVLGLAFSSPAPDTATGFILNVVSSTIAAALTTPAVAAFATVLYIDLRVRKEGFDLFLLAQRLGVEPTGISTAVTDYLPPAPPSLEGEQPPYWPPPPGWKAGG